ncbi:MAG TPA: tetratricopeptide repeat protein [Candidatus Limnocylindria bacterium]|nr:tetratricopeptide repeat protein [Candidatus Limnocylindria bacterium]
MRFRTIASSATLAAFLLAGLAGGALARNPHCAGGIQYVVLGMKDKDKGNLEDYKREMQKAIQQLEQCAQEDPADHEALAYLGWAYAELDSSCAAGRTFAAAIQGLEKKGDKKKVEWAKGNQQHYWARAFNDGIEKIKAAQAAYADYTVEPKNDADKTLREEARKSYEGAIASLTGASCMKPGDPQTIRNLGSVYAFMGDYQKAGAVFSEGLKVAPNDSTLAQSLRATRTNLANQLVEGKRYDEGIQYFEQLIKDEPNNSDHQLSLADVLFRRAATLQGDPQKAEFRRAAESYERAAQLKPDADLYFNGALARQNAGDWEKSEVNWRMAAKLRANDVDILGAWGGVLAELKRFDEAVQVLHQAVLLKPDNKTLHRQLGAAYTKAQNNTKATEELMVYLALQNGATEPDAAAAAKAARDGSAAAKTLATEGAPDALNKWEADNQKYETWFYWKKHQAFTFGAGGTLVNRADWSAAAVKSAAAGGKK